MHNACIGGLGNTSSLPIVMIDVVFENTPFWALGVYGRILKAPIPQYTAVYSGVYGRILRVYGRMGCPTVRGSIVTPPKWTPLPLPHLPILLGPRHIFMFSMSKIGEDMCLSARMPSVDKVEKSQ